MWSRISERRRTRLTLGVALWLSLQPILGLAQYRDPCNLGFADLARQAREVRQTTSPTQYALATWVALPTNYAEVEATYGREELVASQQSYAVRQGRRLLSSAPTGALRTRAHGGVTGLLEFIRSTDATVLSIVGHSDQGQLRLLDGTAVPLEKLANVAQEHQKALILLTCRAGPYVRGNSHVVAASDRDLRLSELVEITRRLEREATHRESESRRNRSAGSIMKTLVRVVREMMSGARITHHGLMIHIDVGPTGDDDEEE